MDFPDIPATCFMVERRNEREVPNHEDCGDPDCTHTETLFDVVRVDTDCVLAEQVWSFFQVPHDLPEGGSRTGMMWFSDWSSGSHPTGPDDWTGIANPPAGKPRGPSYIFADGPCLQVMTPEGPWNVDSRASNCTMPYDYEHRCWVRHGEPPLVTVDKQGLTCEAGAGSIQCGRFHGFLRDGVLVS